MKGFSWRLLRLVMPLNGWIVLAVLLGCVTIGSGIGLMATSAYLISAAALHPSVASLEVAMVGVRFFGIARGVFRYLERYVSHSVTFRLLARLRVWFYTALEPLVPAYLRSFLQETPGPTSGDLLSSMVVDIETLQNFYAQKIAPPVVAALVGIGMWFFLGAYVVSVSLAWLVCFLLAGLVVPWLVYLLSKKLGQRTVALRAELHVQVLDGVQGMADLMAFGQEATYLTRIELLNRKLVRVQAWMSGIASLQSTLSNTLMNLAQWAVLVVAIPLVLDGKISGIFLAVLVLASAASFEAVLPLSSAWQQAGSIEEAARRIFRIAEVKSPIDEPVTVSPQPCQFDLALQHIRFRYQPEEPDVLDDVSFTIQEGKCVAIVGVNGAGKSTLAHLLQRFWDYQEGHILLGGYELRAFHQQDLYAYMSVVAQDTHLFNTTIRENLLMARPDASQGDLVRATQQAQLHEFIQLLPQGYDTRIGEQGLGLSGGERQRLALALARALLKNAPLLILDEPTANVDAKNEHAIFQTIQTMAREHTTLLITHRLSCLEMADEILVLQDGKIQERGKHHELLQQEGLYWGMWHLQQQALRV
jgi:ATP-binding cassette subfamily C protein CydC